MEVIFSEEFQKQLTIVRSLAEKGNARMFPKFTVAVQNLKSLFLVKVKLTKQIIV